MKKPLALTTLLLDLQTSTVTSRMKLPSVACHYGPSIQHSHTHTQTNKNIVATLRVVSYSLVLYTSNLVMVLFAYRCC